MFKKKKKKKKKKKFIYIYIYIYIYGILATKTRGATGLKLGMHTQLDSGSNMGWVPLSHTSSFLVCKAKMPKMVF